MKTAARVLLSGSVVTLVATAPAQVEEGPPATSLWQAMSFNLWRIGAAPAALPTTEQAELQSLVLQGRIALAALDRRCAGARMPADYERMLTAAAQALSRMLAKSTVTREDLACLRLVVQDLQAKQRWAERHRAAPFGPVKIEPIVIGSRAVVARVEIYFRSLPEDATDAAAPAYVSGGVRRVLLRPGCYVFWLRVRDGALADARRIVVHADGSMPRVELVAQ